MILNENSRRFKFAEYRLDEHHWQYSGKYTVGHDAAGTYVRRDHILFVILYVTDSDD